MVGSEKLSGSVSYKFLDSKAMHSAISKAAKPNLRELVYLNNEIGKMDHAGYGRRESARSQGRPSYLVFIAVRIMLPTFKHMPQNFGVGRQSRN